MFFSKFLVFSSAAAFAFAAAIPRDESSKAPKGWWEKGLESYAVYNQRYKDLNCRTQHGTDFFNTCCHPMLAGESLSSRPQECDPSNECEDDGDDDSTTSISHASSPTSQPVNVAPSPVLPMSSPSSSSHSSSHEHKHKATSTTPPASNPAPTAPTGSGKTVKGSGFGTFFFQGGVAGACGDVHQDSDLIVALDKDLYGNTSEKSQYCGDSITITNKANGKQVTAIVADACPTCLTWGSVDLSQGAFDQIAEEATGQIDISWVMHT